MTDHKCIEFHRFAAYRIDRYKCIECGALYYDDGSGKKRPYRCSVTKWRWDGELGRRRRMRYCESLCTEWYCDSAYCSEHRPVSSYKESETRHQQVMHAEEEQRKANLAVFNETAGAIRHWLENQPLAPPHTEKPPLPSLDFDW